MNISTKNLVGSLVPILASLSSSVYCANLHSGAYIGAHTGVTFLSNKYQSALYNVESPNAVNCSYQDSDQSGWNGGVVIGYNFLCNDCYLFGVELGGLYNANNGHYSDKHFFSGGLDSTYNIRYQFDLNFRPGVKISPCTLLYTQLGVTLANYCDTYEYCNASSAEGAPTTYETEDRIWGYTLGVGLQHQITPCIAVFTSYQYTYYGKQDLKTGLEGDPAYFYTNRSTRLEQNTFKIGAIYTF